MTNNSTEERPHRSPEPSQQVEPFSSEVTEHCDAIIQSFEKGTVDKLSALLQIQGIIGRHATEGQSEFAIKALRSYHNMLESFDSRTKSAASKPNATSSGSGGTGNDEEHGGDGDDRDAEEESRGGLVDDTPTLSASGQGVVGGVSSNKRGFAESDGEDEYPESKLAKFDSSTLAWKQKEVLNPTPLRDSCKKSIALYEKYAEFPRQVKNSLFNSPGLPQFPKSEFIHILAGDAVDLDHVLSGVFALSANDRQKEKFGSFEVSFGGSGAPSKVVRSHSDWTIAWDHLVAAMSYVLPHRDDEFKEYGKYIRQLFAAYQPDKHLRVIQFDKAVRTRVSQTRNLLLTDRDPFDDIALVWLQNSGGGGTNNNQTSGSTRGSTSSGSSKIRRRDPCRRFNANICPNTQATCDYLHVCSKCRNSGHVVANCSK